jgi:hypothetical protein
VLSRIKKIAKIIFGIPLALVFSVPLIMLFGAGGPIVFLMFFALYFVIGPLLQLLVRVVPQPAKENQPTPWPQYWGMAFTFVLRAGAVLALFRLLMWVLLVLVAKKSGSIAEEGNFIFLPQWDRFLGGCGLLYAFLSFVQEGLWSYRQSLAVRDLPASTAAAAAIGLVELSGTVRALENRDGPIDPGREILWFYWKLLGTQIGPRGETLLGTYNKKMRPFFLDDGTGKILVDPLHEGVELRRPLISAFTTFFGRRSFEILLTWHIERPSWYERIYSLKEGDQVNVIGYAEMNSAAPSDATGPARLVVRPRKEARAGFESLLQFLFPGRTPARTPQDIFIVADTAEAEAKRLLKKNFVAGAGMSLALAVLSTVLIILAL